jgi:hypothetical protein
LNLKNFIETYSKRLYVVDRAGLDVIYTLSDAPAQLPSSSSSSSNVTSHIDREKQESPPQQRTAPAPAERPEPPFDDATDLPQSINDRLIWFPKHVWLSFSSVATRARVFANKHTGEIVVEGFSDGSPLHNDPAWVMIPPLTRQDHIDMAREFESRLSPEIRSEIGPLIGAPGKWWTSFHIQLSLKSPADAMKWKQFHNARTQQKLIAALQNAGVAAATVAAFARNRAQLGYSTVSNLRKVSSGVSSRLPEASRPDALRSLATVLASLASLINDLSSKQN